MDYQNLMPQQAQPINRIPTGQLPTELAELSEDVLSACLEHDSNALPSWSGCYTCMCSYDGDDAE